MGEPDAPLAADPAESDGNPVRPKPGAVRPSPERLKYRGSRLSNNRFFTCVEPSVRVNGVGIGTGHASLRVFIRLLEYL
jgi:hypothetical protein